MAFNVDPGTIGALNQATLAAVTNVEPYIQTLLNPVQGPDDSLTFWATAVRPPLYLTQAILQSIANNFQTYYPLLLQWAGDLANQDNIVKLVQAITTILANINIGVNAAQNNVQVLAAWISSINQNIGQISDTLSEMEQQYGGDKRALDEAVGAITVTIPPMDAILTDIANRVTTEPIGGVVVAVGELANANPAPTVITIGGLVVSGGSINIANDTANFLQLLQRRGEATQQLVSLTPDIAIVQSNLFQYSELSHVATSLQNAANALFTGWQSLQNAFEATVGALKSATAADQPQVQANLQASFVDWQQVVVTTQRIANQVINIPVRVDTNHPYPTIATQRTVRLATPVVRDINSTGVSLSLEDEQTSGEVIQSLVALIGSLKSDVQSFNTSVDAYGLVAQVQAQEAQVNKLIPELQALGSTLPDQLSALIQATPLDVNAVKALFSQALTSLSPAQTDTATLVSGASTLYSNASKAVSDSAAQVLSLTSQISADQQQIDQLNKEISLDDMVIDTNERIEQYYCSGIFAIFCPVACDLENEITDENAKEDDLETAQNTVDTLNNNLSTAQAQKVASQQFNTSAQSLSNDANKLTQLLQVLTANFNSVATAASADIVQAWATAQAQDLITELRTLVGSNSLAAAPKPTRTRSSQVFLNLVASALSKPKKFRAANKLTTAPPPALLDTLVAINAALVNVYTTTSILAHQPDLALKSAPQFSSQFVQARDHAKQFESDFLNDLLAVFAQISAVSGFAVTLLPKVASLSNDSAVSLVRRIQSQIQSNLDVVTGQAHDFKRFFGLLYRDAAYLRLLGASTFARVDSAVGESSKTVDTLLAQFAKENFSLARGISATLLKAAEEKQTPPDIVLSLVPAPFHVGDVKFAIANVLTDKNVGINSAQSEAIDSISSNSARLAKIDPDFAIFQTIFTQVQQVVAAAKDAVLQVENLVVALENEGKSLDNLVDKIQAGVAKEDISKTLQRWQAIQSATQQFIQLATTTSF